ncbi:hypothetical protein [Aquimarina sp. I32.4]|uniref:hypothetical protein n=1 Tax=Aquimarina sp. I32.4 TaxID=2053903 RepID=UPI000CDE9739|nr:hypothetical protein [Aquimarina sp. I32.4]
MRAKPQSKKIRKENLPWQTVADSELNSSEWFGAIFRYFWYLGKREFNSFYNQEELKKNTAIGYLFKISFVILCIGVVVYYTVIKL